MYVLLAILGTYEARTLLGFFAQAGLLDLPFSHTAERLPQDRSKPLSTATMSIQASHSYPTHTDSPSSLPCFISLPPHSIKHLHYVTLSFFFFNLSPSLACLPFPSSNVSSTGAKIFVPLFTVVSPAPRRVNSTWLALNKCTQCYV